ncbi:MAG: hypothetical protein ABS75_08785 [Pelagibacterium sp. SCN 63-23]|nr:MAG: hypothetical protein ABS75_08785 [Pelagibacterium sp. SCN 63-23]
MNGGVSQSSKPRVHAVPMIDVQGDRHMTKAQEKVLVAALCGAVMTAAAAFAVQPAMAAGYTVETPARVSGVAGWDNLNVRKWPASYSQQTGFLTPGAQVWVERCIEVRNSSDWCLVQRNSTKGWVNSRFLTPLSN